MSIDHELSRLKNNIIDIERLERGYFSIAVVYAELIVKHTYRNALAKIKYAKNVCIVVWYYTLIRLGIIRK